jgi:TonB family protein
MIFSEVTYGIVATCGDSTSAIHLPFPLRLKFPLLERDYPEGAALWRLARNVQERAFKNSKGFEGEHIFPTDPTEEERQLQASAVPLIDALRSGRYDRGFSNACGESRSFVGKPLSDPCDPHPLKTVLEKYRPSYEVPVQMGTLEGADRFHFLSYVSPQYPPLAKLARIEGKVQLSLSIDPDSGEVLDVKVLSGHALLVREASAVVKQWKFDPKSYEGQGEVNVVLDYHIKCP